MGYEATVPHGFKDEREMIARLSFKLAAYEVTECARISALYPSCARWNIVDLARIKIEPFPQEMVFRSISPIVCSTHPKIESKPATYLTPDRPEFVQALERISIHKWEAFNQRTWKDKEIIKIRVWNPKSKLVEIFGIKVRGWHLMVQMWGLEELIRFAYYAGLRERNSVRG
ncbi:MAG: putative CRISPR-associated endoribonuclease-like protein Cas6nc [Candidatus Bathyarchaeota archaeon BA1]|nr:MAG: putative CRISPR-associated endoribonuclease-like protein Cas6nc [Candidatus Bathyarchaeota archaeon BA1]